MTKKKTKRDKSKHPNLDPSMNIKSRRDVADSRHYVKGVKNKEGVIVIPALDEDAKDYLNSFTAEYYNANFSGDSNIHETLIDSDTIEDIKGQIRALKAKRRVIYDKSANTTTQADRDLAGYLNMQIEDIEYFLNKAHPQRSADKANNDRNADLLNLAKRSNVYKVVSWEELVDADLNDVQLDYDFGEKREWDDE